jgi:hypothetical protein
MMWPGKEEEEMKIRENGIREKRSGRIKELKVVFESRL